MSLSEIESLVLVGAGKMGGALLQGWLDGGLKPAAVSLIDPAAGDDIMALGSEMGFKVNPDYGALGVPEIIVIALKPQVMAKVLPDYAAAAEAGSTFLSVAAGQSIGDIERALGGKAQVVRIMPNTPVAVGAGASVLFANESVSAGMREISQALMETVGIVAWIDDESYMDAVTALSGSGPAYVFHLVECMARGGIAAGLPDVLAKKLARQTVIGGGALLDASPLEPDVLRKNVTSPGGTTAAALGVLMGENGLPSLITEAIAAAKKRGQELSG